MPGERRSAVLDVLYVVITVVFFAVGASFTHGCDRLYREKSDG